MSNYYNDLYSHLFVLFAAMAGCAYILLSNKNDSNSIGIVSKYKSLSSFDKFGLICCSGIVISKAIQTILHIL